MAFDYLNEHYLELLNDVEMSGYGKKYRQTIEAVIHTVLSNPQGKKWNSFL